MSGAMQDADVPLVGAAWAMPPDACPRFSVDTSSELRRRGVRGERAVIVLTDSGIGLMGNEGGDQVVPLARVAGLRAGLLRTRRYRQPELRLHLLDPAETLLFHPLGEAADVAASGRGYAGFVRTLVARLAAQGRQDGVETGTAMGWAIAHTALFGIPAAAMLATFAWTIVTPLPEEERWIAPVVTGAVALSMLWLAIWWWWMHWPLRVRRPADLDRMLRLP